jgi:hypothetical protein
VVSSEWKGCKDDEKGEVEFAWNGPKDGGRLDALAVIVCDRKRAYYHHVPDEQSRVDVELHELPPG